MRGQPRVRRMRMRMLRRGLAGLLMLLGIRIVVCVVECERGVDLQLRLGVLRVHLLVHAGLGGRGRAHLRLVLLRHLVMLLRDVVGGELHGRGSHGQ